MSSGLKTKSVMLHRLSCPRVGHREEEPESLGIRRHMRRVCAAGLGIGGIGEGIIHDGRDAVCDAGRRQSKMT